MDFVWVYAKRFSSWYMTGLFNELDYSIRSVRKNYQGDVRCFVVGDDPGLDVIHIPAPPVVMNDQETQQPRQQEIMQKQDAVLESEVNEEFVLICDDIYLLKPTSEEEIKTTYGRCEVHDPEEYIRKRNGGTPYKKLWLKTYEYIIVDRYTKGLKTYDWETHLPRFYTKTAIETLMNGLNLRKFPKIISSLYAAYYGGETKVMPPGFQSDIWTHRPYMDFDKEFEAHYMHVGDDVIVPEFIDKMKEHFG